MARKLTVTKEMIIEAAVEQIRKEGHDSLNVRSLAKLLGCSTQPVLYQFESMEELIQAAYKRADEMHTNAILPKRTIQNPLLELGLNYIRFAEEEKHLFRFLFQTDHFSGKDLAGLTSDPLNEELIQIAVRTFGCTKKQAQQSFQILFIAVHGYASLLANNAMNYDESEAVKMLEKLYKGVK